MCVDATTSITSFIVGSIINICVMLYAREKVIYQICIFWQWVIMMQLAEFLIWSDPDCGILNYTGTKLALFFNLTQPIVLFFVLFFMNDKPIAVQITSIVIIMAYIGFFFHYLNSNKEYVCTTKPEHCTAFNLAWWVHGSTDVVYFVTLILMLLLLSNYSAPIIFTFLYSVITLLYSAKFYWCGAPSMWCWFVVPFPLFLLIFQKIMMK